jgi:hypothetical protein
LILAVGAGFACIGFLANLFHFQNMPSLASLRDKKADALAELRRITAEQQKSLESGAL